MPSCVGQSKLQVYNYPNETSTGVLCMLCILYLASCINSPRINVQLHQKATKLQILAANIIQLPRIGYITVDNGDISAFILLSQVQGVSLLGGHDLDSTTFIGAVQVAFVPPLRAQCLREGERLSGLVSTVWLIPPLHHRGVGGVGVVLALQLHRGKQHGKLLIILYRHMNTVASQPCKKSREERSDHLTLYLWIRMDAIEWKTSLQSWTRRNHGIAESNIMPSKQTGY